MTTNNQMKQWNRIGGISGIAGMIAYFCAAFVPLPDFAGYIAAFSFGPLLSIGLVGLCYRLERSQPRPLTRIAAGFGVAAGVVVLVMLCVQQSLFVVATRTGEELALDASAGLPRYVWDSANAIQLGMDVAWDVLISASVFLFACSMLGHRTAWKICGIIGIAVSLLLFGYNIAYFPVPPAASESIDWGPFVALWLIWVFLLMLWPQRGERFGQGLEDQRAGPRSS